MSNKIFKLNGDTLVAIDWSNVYGWFNSLGWEIDPIKLFAHLNNYQEIYQKNFYFGEDKNNKKTYGFHQSIEDIGYNLVSKEVK